MKLRLLVGAAFLPLAFAMTAQAADTAPSAAVEPAGDGLFGRVVNASGSPLPGAEIIVRGSGRRAVSNTQGEFSLPGLSGDVTLDVRYIGLPDASQLVSVSPGRPSQVTVTLGGDDVTTVADVVVTGVITDGVARSLNQQKNADGTVNILSADAIGRYPDPNVAESLQRVQGVAIQRDQGEGRYINVRGAPAAFTAVSVDGVAVPAVSPTTRAVDLDTLPSDIVSTVEVSKTLTPAQDADSIAGAVDIKTRSPFDKRRLAVSGYAGGSYNDYGGSDTRAGATISNVFGPDQSFGALLSLSYSETNRRPDNVENAWVYDKDAGRYLIEETLFKDYETQRTRQALTGALEWRPSEGLRAWLRGSYAEFEDDEYRDTLRFGYADGKIQPGATDRAATFTGARIYKALRHRTQNNQITTLSTGLERTFDNGAVWDAALSWARSEQTYPHRDELVFRSDSQTLSYDTTDHYRPTYSAFADASGFYRNPAKYSFRENTFRSNDTEQEDVSFKTNFELPTVIAGREVTLKFGGKYSTRDVVADEERFRHRSSDKPAPLDPGTMASLLSDQLSRNYDYNLGFKLNHDLVSDYLARAAVAGSKSAAARRMPQSLTADYTANEDILSGYGQARFDVGATNVLVGLRIEKTDFEGSALNVPNTGAPVKITVDRDQTDFFPNLTLRHSFSDQLIGRFALTRAISRPDYTDVVPRILETRETEDTGGGSKIRTLISRGNPDLKPTLSNNVDLGLEYYLRPLGVISANAFYKDLSDYRFTLVTNGAPYAPSPTGVADITESLNAPDGRLMGIELNWQQTFDFLPGWASGFGVFANYTLTDAEIKTGRSFAGRDTFTLPGQSDTTYNLALFYERAGLSARVSYTHRSDYLEAINAERPGLDLWVEGRGQLDFTASYDFGNGVEVFGEAKNLTDTAGVRYYGVKERTYEYEKFGYNVFMGVRFKY
ncbi:TonB-dependent receptor [Brevundimonas faecalis]|uniref:TonB-dependent receptor n=1 Tax=Brevundimonas faecalis TaxID=947378 RepID=A0ABV2RBF0_9CAUL